MAKEEWLMVEAFVNFVIWAFKTVASDEFWSKVAIIAIIVSVAYIIIIAMNRCKDHDEKVESVLGIVLSIAMIIIAVIILLLAL